MFISKKEFERRCQEKFEEGRRCGYCRGYNDAQSEVLNQHKEDTYRFYFEVVDKLNHGMASSIDALDNSGNDILIRYEDGSRVEFTRNSCGDWSMFKFRGICANEYELIFKEFCASAPPSMQKNVVDYEPVQGRPWTIRINFEMPEYGKSLTIYTLPEELRCKI